MDRNLEKIAHYIVEKFISLIKESFVSGIIIHLDVEKVYCEIVKFGEIVIQELRDISEHANMCLKTKDENVHDLREFLKSSISCNKRIVNLVNKIFSPGYIQATLDGSENYRITDGDLYKYLYFGIIKDVTDFTEVPIHMKASYHFGPPTLTLPEMFNNESTQISILNNGAFSVQFEENRRQYHDELCSMQKITKEGFAALYSEATTLRNGKSDNQVSVDRLCTTEPSLLSHQKKKMPFSGGQSFSQRPFWSADSLKISGSNDILTNRDHIGKINSLLWWNDADDKDNQCSSRSEFSPLFANFGENTALSDSEVVNLSDNLKEPERGFHSWENCLGGNFLNDYKYISELSDAEAVHIISGKEYSLYSSLLNSTNAISEDDMVHDILDALVGTPSNTFFYDVSAERFRIKSGVHIQNMSAECCSSFLPNFLDCGSMYYALQKFCQNFTFTNEGSVVRGMKRGIQKVLTMYKEYIEAIKVNHPSMLFLKSDILKNAQLFHEFGVICGIDPDTMLSRELPKGLGLLEYLHDLVRSHNEKEKIIMIYVLLKYAYEPYISFLNGWLNEGICNDPYAEFQIIEDPDYLQRCDSLYWHFAYTKSINDPTRAVPSELEVFSDRFLECGKSINLLKDISPELSTLKFFSVNPPPSLSLVFSFPAIIYKIFSCLSYMILRKDADCNPKTAIFDTYGDEMYLENQKLVNEKQMLKLVKSKSDFIFAHKPAKSNIHDFKKISHYLEDYQTNFHDESDCLKDNFSGKLHDNVGLLFSSCGFKEKEVSSDCLVKDFVPNNFPSHGFSLQLCLSSYTNKLSAMPIDESQKLRVSDTLQTLLPDSFLTQLPNNKTNEILCLDKVSESDRKLLNIYFETLTDSARNLTLAKTKKDQESRNIFVDKLASLLISECGESLDDIYSCVQFISLQRLMILNFQYTLNIRSHVIERAIMKSIMKQYKLDFLLQNLRKFYFLQDASFSEKLCEPLFYRVMQCKTSKEFADVGRFRAILYSAIPDLDVISNSELFSLDAAINFRFSDMSMERPDFLNLFLIECEVSWPLNIIVHERCLLDYSKIFSMLLKFEFLFWLLLKTFKHLHNIAKEKNLNDSPQFHVIMGNRFKIEHFIRVIRDSVYVQLQGSVWKDLKEKLSEKESTIDLLIYYHEEYLRKVLARCFLINQTEEHHGLLSSMLHQVFRFCYAVLNCEWKKNADSGKFETSIFKWLTQIFRIFEESQKRFQKCLSKKLPQDETGHFWEEGYQEFIVASLEIYRY